MKRLGILLVLVIGVVAAVWALAPGKQRTDLTRAPLPSELQIVNVQYAMEKSRALSWLSFRDNHKAGVIVFNMPAAIAKEIETAGLEWFKRLSADSAMATYSHEQWTASPITNGEWVNASISTKPKLATFLDKRGFGIQVRADIEKMIDESVATQGSYYSVSHKGVLIVMPAKRQVVFAYAG